MKKNYFLMIRKIRYLFFLTPSVFFSKSDSKNPTCQPEESFCISIFPFRVLPPLYCLPRCMNSQVPSWKIIPEELIYLKW